MCHFLQLGCVMAQARDGFGRVFGHIVVAAQPYRFRRKGLNDKGFGLGLTENPALFDQAVFGCV